MTELAGEQSLEWKLEKIVSVGSFDTVYEVADNGVGTRGLCKRIVIPTDKQCEAALKLTEGVLDSEAKEKTNEIFKNIFDIVCQEINTVCALSKNNNVMKYYNHHVEYLHDPTGYEIFISTEYLQPFNQFLKTHALTVGEAIKLAKDVCIGLEGFHNEGGSAYLSVNDRALFVDENGNFKLGDISISRLLSIGGEQIINEGTSYWAPEVFRGAGNVTSDVFSLGILLYRIFNKNKFPVLKRAKKTGVESVGSEIYHRSWMKFDLPPKAPLPLAKVIVKACSPFIENRYQSPQEFLKALKDAENKIAQWELDSKIAEAGETVFGMEEISDDLGVFIEEEEETAVHLSGLKKTLAWLVTVSFLGLTIWGIVSMSYYFGEFARPAEPISAISLAKTKISLPLDSGYLIEYATVPRNNVTNPNLKFHSSKESVATVSGKGYVYGVGIGSSIITVSTDDGIAQTILVVEVTN